MDLDAATKPQGVSMIATLGEAIGDLRITEGSTRVFSLGPAFGGNLSHHLKNSELIVIDGLGAPFKRSLNDKNFANLFSPARHRCRLAGGRGGRFGVGLLASAAGALGIGSSIFRRSLA